MNNLRNSTLALVCSLSVLTMNIRLNPGVTGEIIDAISSSIEGVVSSINPKKSSSIRANTFHVTTDSGKK